GAELAMSGPVSGIYAEQQAARVDGAFDGIFHALSNARPDILAREHDAPKLPGVYEFPREFRKLRRPLVEFLVDLCRPSQLSVGPFLRGFYFSGVRPTVVQEAQPPAGAAAAVKQHPAYANHATAAFRVSGGSRG